MHEEILTCPQKREMECDYRVLLTQSGKEFGILVVILVPPVVVLFVYGF